MSLEIRPMQEADADTLVSICKKTNVVCYRDILPAEAVEAYNNSGAIEDHFREHLQNSLVVTKDGLVVAGGTQKGNQVLLMMVDLDLHRSGVGSMLLRALEETLFENNETLTLDCFRDNEQGVRFYEKNGWCTVGEKEDMGIPHVVMEKCRGSS